MKLSLVASAWCLRFAKFRFTKTGGACVGLGFSTLICSQIEK